MIRKPTSEEVELAKAEERLEREQNLDFQAKKLDLETKLSLRQASLHRKAKTACVWAIAIIVLFGKPVPPVLERFLDS